ncbi:MAG: hypothetical protein QXD48_01050 [Candidatus Aenigmatarchaeota archaeon]
MIFDIPVKYILLILILLLIVILLGLWRSSAFQSLDLIKSILGV